MRNNKYESGRSMVEMLGTLAIIGVLSIGGIAGYSYGMDKYRANETINDVNLRGIDLVRQVATNQPLSLSEWPAVSKAGYSISKPVLSAEGDAYFSLFGVPKRVCEMVYNGIMQNQTTDVEVNGYVVDDSSACGDDNKMGFFFITNAGEGGTTADELCKDVNCPEGSSCTHGICMSEEIPQLHSNNQKVCKNYKCPECQYCHDYGYEKFCSYKKNGSSCQGGSCYEGKCILNDTECTEHSDCGNGYYCDKYEGGTTFKCIKLNFYKIPENEVYISINETWVNDLCELINLHSVTKEQMMRLTQQIGDSIISYSPYFHTTDSGACNRDGACYNTGHALCVSSSVLDGGEITPFTPHEAQTEIGLDGEETTTETETATYPEETVSETDIACNCGSGYYCADTNESCYEANPNGECVEANSQFKEEKINGTTYYISKNPMSWWDAVSACKALGNKKLLSVEDMIIRFDDDVIGSYSNPGEDTISYASHPGHELTELGKALYNKGWNNTGSADVWSNILLEYNSCYAYPVELNSGIVSGYGGNRNENNRMYAICR